jgi:hypothetical protein
MKFEVELTIRYPKPSTIITLTYISYSKNAGKNFPIKVLNSRFDVNSRKAHMSKYQIVLLKLLLTLVLISSAENSVSVTTTFLK